MHSYSRNGVNAVEVGDAPTEGNIHRGWFIGHFMEGLRNQRDVEVKWGRHSSGDTNGRYTVNDTATTLTVLIEGSLQITFKQVDGAEQEVSLSSQGQYVVWAAGVSHMWIALSDVVALTCRWPSVDNDHHTVQQGH